MCLCPLKSCSPAIGSLRAILEPLNERCSCLMQNNVGKSSVFNEGLCILEVALCSETIGNNGPWSPHLSLVPLSL